MPAGCLCFTTGAAVCYTRSQTVRTLQSYRAQEYLIHRERQHGVGSRCKVGAR